MTIEHEDLAKQHGLVTTDEAIAFHALAHSLRLIADDNKLDQGIGLGGADYWLKVNGVEFFITARKSNNQIKKESQ